MSEETDSASANASPGDKIAGYQLEEQIGQGGMAVVYRAHDERLDRSVALKLLAPGLASDTAFRTRFIRESRAAAAVDHPNIIPVYDAGDAGGFLFIAMRYVQGGDVRSLLSGGRTIPAERVWNIISQVAAALDAAHAHDLIHRDVKPANMLLDTSAGNTGPQRGRPGTQADHVYLSDFGISKQTLASHLTSTGQFVGTLDYIAPETIEGRAIDGSVDQYSLACAAYELFTGEPPFRRDLGLALLNAHLSQQPPSIVAKRPELPGPVDLVLAKAMAKTSAERYGSCAEFAADLGKALSLTPGVPLVGATTPRPAPDAAGVGQPGQWPATELAAPAAPQAGAGTTNQAAQAPPAAPAANQPPPAPAANQPPVPQWPAGKPGGFDAATQYAGQPGPGPHGPGQMGQTPRPQPGNWQAGQPNPGGGYQQFPPYQPYQQPYPAGQPGPGWQGYPPAGQAVPGWPPPRQPRRSRGILIGTVIATVAVAVAAIAVVYLVVIPRGKHSNASGGGNSAAGQSSTSPNGSQSSPASTAPVTPMAKSEATAVASLLSSSATSRQQWDSNVLVTNVGDCVAISSDVTQINDIAQERTSELKQATHLRTSAIPNGSVLKSQLVTALRISLNIDRDYLAWARQQESSGCAVGTNSTYYDRANSQDSQATTDKQAFVSTWNPIASTYNLQQFSAGQI